MTALQARARLQEVLREQDRPGVSNICISPDFARTILTALEAKSAGIQVQLNPDGVLSEPENWKLPAKSAGVDREALSVPRNPTEVMMDAGLYHCSADMTHSDLWTAWQAMFDTIALDGGVTESLPSALTSPSALPEREALDSSLEQALRCPKCWGRGTVNKLDAHFTCRTCEGSGIASFEEGDLGKRVDTRLTTDEWKGLVIAAGEADMSLSLFVRGLVRQALATPIATPGEG